MLLNKWKSTQSHLVSVEFPQISHLCIGRVFSTIYNKKKTKFYYFFLLVINNQNYGKITKKKRALEINSFFYFVVVKLIDFDFSLFFLVSYLFFFFLFNLFFRFDNKLHTPLHTNLGWDLLSALPCWSFECCAEHFQPDAYFPSFESEKVYKFWNWT